MESVKGSILIVDDEKGIRDMYEKFIEVCVNCKNKLLEIISLDIEEKSYADNLIVKNKLYVGIKEQLQKGLKFIVLDGSFVGEFCDLLTNGMKLSINDFKGIKIYLSSGYNDPSLYAREMSFLKEIGINIVFVNKTDYKFIINDLKLKICNNN